MSGEIAQWNLLQIAFIAVYPAWFSFTKMPSGMSLLAVYLFLILLCVPPVFIQLKLGNHQQKGIVGLLSKHIPLLKGVGIMLLIQLFMVCVYLVPLVTHYGLYAFIAISQHPYVWGQCGNTWNTDQCHDVTTYIPQNAGPVYQMIDKSALHTPEGEFFDQEYLQISGNISDIRGFATWNFSEPLKNFSVSILPLAVVAVWLLIFLAIAFGGRVCGWILFVLGPAFLSLVFVTLGYGYSNMDKNGTDTFLHDIYTLDMDQFNTLHDQNTPLIKDWTKGFELVMNALPVWTAILPTMGKMTGNGRLSRNISWLLVILVYAATCQLPQLTMAPYIGHLQQVVPDIKYKVQDVDVVFTTMAAAFVNLEVPPVYAMLFYLGLFVAGLMFLIVAMFVILDNMVDGLTDWVETFQDRRGCVNFCASFVLISLGVGAAILHTTQAGLYYIILMDQCVSKLYFLTVALYGFSLIIIYARQNFGIAERIIMCMWCTVATVTSSAIFLYCFISEIDSVPGYHGVKIGGTWDLVCWVFASAPFLAIPAAMIHSCQQEDGSFVQKIRYVFCGTKQDEFDPPQVYGYHRPEPSAPPYGTNEMHTYAYMDDGNPQEDLPYYTSHKDH